MTLLRSTLVASALFLSANAAQAQGTHQLKFQSGPGSSPSALGYYVGPFKATVLSDPTRPTIDIFCVDILNSISWNRVWNANYTSLGQGNLSLTRRGTAKIDAYKKAAWLTSKYSTVATTQWGGIQAAVWELLNPGNPNGGGAETAWLNQANQFQATGGFSTFDFSRYTIITDVGAAGRRVGGGTQEFITDSHVTPEPGTYLLIGSGLVLMLAFAGLKGGIRV